MSLRPVQNDNGVQDAILNAKPLSAALVRALDVHVRAVAYLWQRPPWTMRGCISRRVLDYLAVELVLPLVVLDLQHPDVGIA
jgi:hypothetical protein